jgi:hypothetical protein
MSIKRHAGLPAAATVFCTMLMLLLSLKNCVFCIHRTQKKKEDVQLQRGGGKKIGLHTCRATYTHLNTPASIHTLPRGKVYSESTQKNAILTMIQDCSDDCLVLQPGHESAITRSLSNYGCSGRGSSTYEHTVIQETLASKPTQTCENKNKRSEKKSNPSAQALEVQHMLAQHVYTVTPQYQG